MDGLLNKFTGGQNANQSQNTAQPSQAQQSGGGGVMGMLNNLGGGGAQGEAKEGM
jgi:hypothetical protein